MRSVHRKQAEDYPQVPDFNFDPRYWYWLFEGQARVEFDAMTDEEQRNVVRATLRFNMPRWLHDIVEDERIERERTLGWFDKDWDRQVYKLPHVSERCRIIITKQYIPVPVGL